MPRDEKYISSDGEDSAILIDGMVLLESNMHWEAA
jgi:hypothetical protein